MPSAGTRLRIALLVAILAFAGLAVSSPAKMTSTELGGKLCLTEGGGRFVDIPNFPGEMIDRRLLRDVNYLQRRFDIFVTDGYSTADYHSRDGEHPIGLALDIVPQPGDDWKKITKLAKWAEPHQNQVRAPFRWVGYNGDENHGRGDHLHLSWSHSETKPKRPAKSVYTLQCPRKKRGRSAFDAPRLAPPVPETAGTRR